MIEYDSDVVVVAAGIVVVESIVGAESVVVAIPSRDELARSRGDRGRAGGSGGADWVCRRCRGPRRGGPPASG